ncbi:MAG: winged helix-turn-helix transcriptional regulator, partial [Eubacterium sp.]|nr:winged helix-turn-helix transcriptional regulator [Eubacterium sp.]
IDLLDIERSIPGKLIILIQSGSISNKSIEEGKRFVSRYYRNRRLGDFLKELDLSEGHSTGVPTIQEELEKNGSPKAIFHTDEDRRAMRIQIPIHPAFLKEKEPSNINDVEKGINLKNSFQNERSLKEVLKGVLSKSELKKTSTIVEYLTKNGEITPKTAEEITGKSPTTAWRYLKSLVDAGVVESEGGTNNLVYRLTDEYLK